MHRSEDPDLSALAGSAIVFDLDGTLVDTAPDIMAALNAILAAEGAEPVSLAQTRLMIGRGPRAQLVAGFAASGLAVEAPRLAVLHDRFLYLYHARIARESQPFEGALAALDALSAAGARLAVCTNKPQMLATALLDALDLAPRFAAIVGPEAAPAAKPDPAHLLAAVAQAGGDPARALMVGDTAVDAAAARAAGAPVALVTFGYSDVPVETLAPDALVGHYDELPAVCLGLLTCRSARPGL